MSVPASVRWIGLALLGLTIAAAVALAASNLASQQIGLASEPISAGDALAPHPARQGDHGGKPRHKTIPTSPGSPSAPETTTASPPTTPAEPTETGESGDDRGEGSSGASGGEPADD